MKTWIISRGVVGSFTVLVGWGALPACSSTTSADTGGASDDGGTDADGGTEAGPPEGSAGPVPPPSCAAGQKSCAGECVSVTDPSYGCGGPSCDPCDIPNGHALCGPDGACVFGACSFPFADCAGTKTSCATNLQTDDANCGACGHVCPPVDHGTGSCKLGVCAVTCETGYNACNGACTPDGPAACGKSCAVCPAPANGTPTCAHGQCGFACDAGFHACGPFCEAEGPLSCGPSCTVCPQVPGGTATCTNGQCGAVCQSPLHMCGGACVFDDVNACGPTCAKCAAPEHGRPTCTSGVCDFDCGGGIGVRCGNSCCSIVSYIREGYGSQDCVNTVASGMRCFGPDGTLSATLYGSTELPFAIAESSACERVGNGVECWGDNFYGQLGDGTNTSHSTLSTVVGLAGPVADLSLGSTHACALLTNGTVQCWGENTYGQIGDGTTTNRNVATTVPGLSGITAVSAGVYRTCAIGAGGSIWCWGSSHGAGAIGDGTTSDRHVPTAVYGLTAAVQVAVGDEHTCARISNGTVWCWGDNTHGAVGDGTTTNRTTPSHVPALTGVTDIRVTVASTCALLAGGAVKCWGYNGVGAVGDGTLVDRTSPTPVAGLTTGVTALAHGGFFFCALVGGVVECWGGGPSPYVKTPKPIEGIF